MSNSYLLIFLCATAAAAHVPDPAGADVQAFVQSSMSASEPQADDSTNVPPKTAQMIIDDAVDAVRQDLTGNNTILRAGEKLRMQVPATDVVCSDVGKGAVANREGFFYQSGVFEVVYHVEQGATFPTAGRLCNYLAAGGSNFTAFTPAPTRNPPVNCVGSWGEFGACSKTCGGGTETKTYTVTTAAQYGGDECGDANGGTESQPCNNQLCAVNCQGTWGTWDGCSTECGGGTHSKTFTITANLQNGGNECNYTNGQKNTTACTKGPCPVDCVGSWSTFSACSKTCGGGNKSRTYIITTLSANGGNTCSATNNQDETQNCNPADCPVPMSAFAENVGLAPFTKCTDFFNYEPITSEAECKAMVPLFIPGGKYRGLNPSMYGCWRLGSGLSVHFGTDPRTYKNGCALCGQRNTLLVCKLRPPLENLGPSGCTQASPCMVCQGDCNTDNDCAGASTCFQRTASAQVLGCRVGGNGDVGGYDYCMMPKTFAINTDVAPYNKCTDSINYEPIMSAAEGECNSRIGAGTVPGGVYYGSMARADWPPGLFSIPAWNYVYLNTNPAGTGQAGVKNGVAHLMVCKLRNPRGGYYGYYPDAPWPLSYADSSCVGTNNAQSKRFGNYPHFFMCQSACAADTSCIGFEYGSNGVPPVAYTHQPGAYIQANTMCHNFNQCKCFLAVACTSQPSKIDSNIYLKLAPTPA